MNENFSVPEPCGEKWEGMQPDENGRFCGSCQKTVVDFTTKTNEEILDYLKDRAGKRVCGTFKISQLPENRSYHYSENAVRFLAALLLVFGTSLFSCQSIALGDLPEGNREASYEDRLIGIIVLPPVKLDTNKVSSNCYQYGGNLLVVDEEVICDPKTGKPYLNQKIEGRITGEPSLNYKNPDTVLNIAEVMPTFPGGADKMSEFIVKNLRYPDSSAELGTEGTVYVSFIVRKNGKKDEIKILRGLDEAINKEALRVVQLMPDFSAGRNNGKTVDVRCFLPLKFRLK